MPSFPENIPCIYFSCSETGDIVKANKELCGRLGYAEDELTGKKLDILFTLSTKIFQQTHLFPLLRIQEYAEEIYITLKTKTGEPVPVLINAIRSVENGKGCYQFAGISLLKRKKFEEEIIAAKRAAEQALKENTELKALREKLLQQAKELDTQIRVTTNQNEELKQFTHIATHIFQEPLRKLMYFFNSMCDTQNDPSAKTLFEKNRQTAEGMYKKLKHLQEYVWLNNEEFEAAPVELPALIQETTDKLRTEYPTEQYSINISQTELPAIKANTAQILLLFHAIFSNSIQYRKPGIPVMIDIGASIFTQNRFKNLGEGHYQFEKFVKLEISDNGRGFNDEFKEHVFGIFSKLHGGVNLGMGLSMCKRVVENHRGEINIRSTPGIGTTVNIILPLEL